MATFTASEINALKAVHVGENVVYSRFEDSVTVSEIVLLARIPNGAIIDEWRLTGGTAVDGATGTWKIGFYPTVVDHYTGNSLSDVGLHATASLTASGLVGSNIVTYSVSASIMVATRAVAVPIKVSMSDDVVPQYTWIGAKLASASGTATTNMQFMVKYRVDE